MRCTRCGHEYAEGALFCSDCGEVAPNLSEENARMAAVLNQSRRITPVGPNISAPRAAGGIKGPAEFGTAAIAFAIGSVLFTVSLVMMIIFAEEVIFNDGYPRNSEITDIAERVMSYTSDLAWIALVAGVLLILRGIAEKRRRMEGILWPDYQGMNTAATVALVALALVGIVFVADLVTNEIVTSTDQWNITFRVVLYLYDAAMIMIALTLYVAADSLRRANAALQT